MTSDTISRHPVPQHGGTGWREQKKQLTREALHTAARERVLAAGLAAVTVEEVCAQAGVSARTFFNYFPSKAAAALGLPDLTITEEQRLRFLDATGNPVRDLCDLVADVVLQSGDRLSEKSHLQDLVRARPEVRPELLTWLAETRKRFTEVAEQRTPSRSARSAVGLVLTSLGDLMETSGGGERDLADRLWASVIEIAEFVLTHPDGPHRP